VATGDAAEEATGDGDGEALGSAAIELDAQQAKPISANKARMEQTDP